EVGEWAIYDLDCLTGLQGHLELGGGCGLHLLEDGVGFIFGEGGGLGAYAYEACDTGGVTHDVPGLFVHDHFDQDVAWEDFTLDGLALAAFDLYLFDGRDFDPVNAVANVVGEDALLEVLLDLVLVAGVRVDNVPVAILSRGVFNGCVGRDHAI